MRILHITPSFQHPTMRGPTRHYHFLRELSARHTITLLALSRGPITPEARDEMTSRTARLLSFATPDEPEARRAGGAVRLGCAAARELGTRAAVRRLRAAFRDESCRGGYDVVLFHGKHLFPVIADTALPVVTDFCDATSMRLRSRLHSAPLARRPLVWLRYQQVRQLEERLVRKTPHLAFISERDRDAVLGPGAPAAIIPNGVDHIYWKRRREARPAGNSIIFTGVMDYAPNADGALQLVEHIAPRLRAALPDLEVLIVGRAPSAALRARAARLPGVQVTGFVEDVRPWLERAAVCVAPLRYASGMQNKVLEALAMQVPVVTTPVVAAGLRLNGAEPPLVTAGDPETFAQATLRLLRDATARMALARRGRRFVETNLCWKRSAEKLEEMCRTAASPQDTRIDRHRCGRAMLEVSR